MSTNPIGKLPPRVHHELGWHAGARWRVQQYLYPRWRLVGIWPSMDAAWVGPFSWPAATERDPEREREHAMGVLQKHLAVKEKSGDLPPPLTGVMEGLPGIVEFMSITAYGDGQVRRTATLLVFLEDGQLKVCLNDRDAERSLWRSGTSLEDALLSVEIALQGDGCDWRKSQSGNGGPKRKK